MVLIDLVGRKFGKLTVISRGPDTNRKNKAPRWYCRCDCGNPEFRLVEGADLRSKIEPTLTCGCGGEGIGGTKNRVHGLSKTGIYSTYIAMHRRCYVKKNKCFKDYGGRGIKVCDRWHENNKDGLANFVKDMGGERPVGGSLERKDVNGDYTPENCMWIPLRDQAKNTRQVFWVYLLGQRMSLSSAARLLRVNPSYLKFHINKGNDPDTVLAYITEKRAAGKMISGHKGRYLNGN